jgi:hypothetical protein
MVSIISQHLLSTELGQVEAHLARLETPPDESAALMRMTMSASSEQTLSDCKHLEVTLQAVRCEHTAADSALQSALQQGDEMLREASSHLQAVHDELVNLVDSAAAEKLRAQRQRRQSYALPLQPMPLPKTKFPLSPDARTVRRGGGGSLRGPGPGYAAQAAARLQQHSGHPSSASANALDVTSTPSDADGSWGAGRGIDDEDGAYCGLGADAASIRAAAVSIAGVNGGSSILAPTPHLDELTSLEPGSAPAGVAMDVDQTRALASALAAAIEATAVITDQVQTDCDSNAEGLQSSGSSPLLTAAVARPTASKIPPRLHIPSSSTSPAVPVQTPLALPHRDACSSDAPLLPTPASASTGTASRQFGGAAGNCSGAFGGSARSRGAASLSMRGGIGNVPAAAHGGGAPRTAWHAAVASGMETQRTPRLCSVPPRHHPSSIHPAGASMSMGTGGYSSSPNAGAPWSPFSHEPPAHTPPPAAYHAACEAFPAVGCNDGRADRGMAAAGVRETPKAQLVFRPTPNGLKLVVD